MSARVKGVMGYWFPPEVDRGYTKRSGTVSTDRIARHNPSPQPPRHPGQRKLT